MKDQDSPDSPAPDRRWLYLAIAIAVVVAPFVLFAGSCNQQPRQHESLGGSASKAESLNTAMAEFRRADGRVDMARACHYLNQWAELGGTDVPDFQPPPYTKDFPNGMSAMAQAAGFDRKEFPLSDAVHLQEAIWCREVTRWVSQGTTPPRFAPWLDEVGKQQGADVQEQLKVSLLLFDWTVRNIRLEKLLPPSPPPVSGAGNSPESYPAAFRGTIGPGYSRLPSQVLLTSRGDAWQRGWLFLLLTRQAGIEGVMLGVEPENHVGEPIPWCPAVLIAGELYLFDSELGLPITSGDGTAVVTWKELRANPELLRKFDLENIASYKVTEKELERVVPLAVASPESLSARMQALESSLKGQHHLQLTVPVRDLASQLAKMEGLGHLRLWHVPWEAIIFKEIADEARKNNDVARSEFITHYSFYYTGTPLYFGRLKHIRGQFDTEDREKGARDLYLDSRAPNASIDQLALQSDQAAKVMEHAKEDATFFLALAQYEKGNYEQAKEWFERVIKQAQSPWVGAARYNLGRCYEAEGNIEQARNEYFNDTDSVQRVGSILRAGVIRNDKAAAKEPEPAHTQPEDK